MSLPFLAVVVWNDAWSAGITVMTTQEIKEKHRPSVMQTLGWVIISDDQGVSLANERCLDQGEECYRGHTFIPSCLVKSVTPFKLTTRKRKPKPAAQCAMEPHDGRGPG